MCLRACVSNVTPRSLQAFFGKKTEIHVAHMCELCLFKREIEKEREKVRERERARERERERERARERDQDRESVCVCEGEKEREKKSVHALQTARVSTHCNTLQHTTDSKTETAKERQSEHTRERQRDREREEWRMRKRETSAKIRQWRSVQGVLGWGGVCTAQRT